MQAEDFDSAVNGEGAERQEQHASNLYTQY